MPYPVHGHGRSTKSRRGLAGLGSGERRSLPRPMAAIVAPKPLPFLTFLTTRLPARRSTQTSCSSSAGRRGPAVAATPRPACRVHSRFRSLLPPSAAASPPTAAVGEGMSDPELRLVLELATDEELMEVEEILYGTSYFSPLLKSIARRPNSDGVVVLDDIEERDHFISKLESRFLYLAADARSIISHKKDRLSFPWDKQKSPKETSSLGANNWKVLTDVAWRVGRKGMETTFLKGGSALTLKTIYESLASRLSGKLLKEAANYEIKKELVKQGGRLAAVNLESRAGLLAARQGLARAASRYVGLRSVMTFLGPIMWGTLLADIVIQMLGTDYARIVQAIYAFAQIRLTRTSYIEPDEE
ncbi:hypothetical protein BDA96_02G231400 [Sorghum bicolor]|uniref:Uncharacterized protein n=1 Tax=Sorghum bicolor TaxID=4558 RepID=A0A921RR93_SORBI|nr:hypothetical protein BDA96_02G231400 [Sorghum bicolor]